jgi:hypothetical protein
MNSHFAADLCAALAGCRSSATLIAPFIKSGVIRRLLDVTPVDVPLTVVTRWRPMEIAMGVSDLDVLDLCKARTGSRLLLLDSLHAKYYRADGAVFVGSANLTGAGLGWSSVPNIEILHRINDDESWRRFEDRLIAAAIPATTKIRDAVQLAAAALPELTVVRSAAGLPAEGEVSTQASSGGTRWLPRSRSPEGVRYCYFGRKDLITRAAMEAGQEDIAALRLPSGLSESQLLPYIKSALLQQPFVEILRGICHDAPRFGELKARVRVQFAGDITNRDPTEVTQTLMRWVTFFLPDQFRVQVFRFSEHLQSDF